MASTNILKSRNWNDSFRIYVNEEGLRVLVGCLSFDGEVYGLVNEQYQKKLKNNSSFCFYCENKNVLPHRHILQPQLACICLKYGGEEVVMTENQIKTYNKHDKRKHYNWVNKNVYLFDMVAKKAFESMQSPSNELKRVLLKMK